MPLILAAAATLALAVGQARTFKVSAYSIGCDAPGPFTAIGARPVAGLTVSADWSLLPPGTVVSIEGVGVRVVEDRGSDVVGLRLDVYGDSCLWAAAQERHRRRVTVLRGPGGKR